MVKSGLSPSGGLSESRRKTVGLWSGTGRRPTSEPVITHIAHFSVSARHCVCLFLYLASRNAFRCPLREGCFNFRIALTSICRIRSRVTSNSCPSSSSVLVESSPIPNRLRSIFASFGLRV